MSTAKTKKNRNILLYFFVVSIVSATTGYFLGNGDKPDKEITPIASPSPLIIETPIVQLLAIQNADMYVDKDKGVAFQYPKDTHRIRIDSEAEYNKATNSRIPDSFMELKGFEAPQVAWALKVEEIKPYQGRYGEESPLTPFSVWVFENSANLDIEEWFEKYWYYPFTWGDATEEIINKMRPKILLNVDGVNALGVDMGSTPRGYQKYMYVQHGTRMYLFELYGDGSNRSLADQIISSFKYLKTY